MIDLDAYLRRIGHTGSRTATLATLGDLCALHPASIAYENIDPLLGTPPELDLAKVQAKLVQQRRGGYCFEQNLLLMQALKALGFRVTALAARVVWMRQADAPPRPRSHMLLLVEVPGEMPHLVDAGFGGNLMDTPLRLEPDLPQRTPHALLRITREHQADGEVYTAETQLPAGWAPMYRFTLEPHAPADFEPLNWYTATHPTSIFCHNLLMERSTPAARISLFNDRRVMRRPGMPPAISRIETLADFERSLAGDFGIELPAETVATLYDRVPKGLDQFVVPSG